MIGSQLANTLGTNSEHGRSSATQLAGILVMNERESSHLHVVSWNIQFGIDVDTAIDVLGTHPDLKGADIICLQEMDAEGSERIAAALGHKFFYSAGSVHSRTNRDFGNAVLATSDLARTGVVRLPHKAAIQGQSRIAVYAQVQAQRSQVMVCSVHTEIPILAGKKRLAQFETVALATIEWPEAVIVAGDFNTVTAGNYRQLAARMQARGLISATDGDGPTLRRRGIRYRLDHIFTRGFTAHESGVAVEAPGSDHDPVWVKLEQDGDGS